MSKKKKKEEIRIQKMKQKKNLTSFDFGLLPTSEE